MSTREQILLQEQKQKLLAEANALCDNPKATRADLTRANVLIAQAASLKTTEQLQTIAAAKLEEITGQHVALPSDTVEARNERENASLRAYLSTGNKELRTYTGMNLGTDSAGGFFVPQSMSDRVWFMLKQQDRLFDPSVVTFFETEHGNNLSVPVTDDNSVSAVTISEQSTSSEAELGTIDRLSLGKVPTWRSKKMVASIELIQDSAFPMESLISANAVRRFAKGIGAANVSTLIAGASSGATSTAPGAVSYADLLALMGSVDPAYLASPKCYWTMNFATLISLFLLKDATTNRPVIKPKTDANGNFILLTKPVAICPSMDGLGVATGKPIALGAMDRFLVRTVKGYPRLQRFEQAQALAENGMVAFEMYLRTNSGLLVASGSDSPVKYITLHA